MSEPKNCSYSGKLKTRLEVSQTKPDCPVDTHLFDR